jgi:hypothetical protein
LFSKQQKKQLLQNGIVACHQVLRDPKILSDIGIHEDKVKGFLKEVEKFVRHQQEGVVKKEDLSALLKSREQSRTCSC